MGTLGSSGRKERPRSRDRRAGLGRTRGEKFVNICEYFPKNFTQTVRGYCKEDLGFSSILVHILLDNVQLGPDWLGILWKSVVIVSYLGSVTLNIFFYRTLHDINESMKCLKDRKKDQVKTCERTTWARIKYERHQNVKNMDLSGYIKNKLKGSDLRGSSCNICHPEGIKKNFNICEELGYRKAENEAKLRTTETIGEHHYKMYEEQLAELEEELRKEKLKRAQCQGILAQADQKLQQVTEEVESYREANLTHREEIESMKEQQQLVELHRRHQIATSEMAAHHYWLKTQVLARERVEQAREAARLRHRLEMMQEVEYGAEKPAPRKSETQSPPRTDSRPQSVPRRSSVWIPSENADNGEVEVDARGPPGVPGPADVFKPMTGPLSALRDHGPFSHPWFLLRLSTHLKGHHSDNHFEI
ncbi:uncharacterized protein LOC105885322 isoform X1 [Microcebus murinus]|uniref:uncharacterized protein LOC105885322 isoform X1 n=1 Tax=Microcebus murinus TaxID=30608 RepID=UPI003F6B2B2E